MTLRFRQHVLRHFFNANHLFKIKLSRLFTNASALTLCFILLLCLLSIQRSDWLNNKPIKAAATTTIILDADVKKSIPSSHLIKQKNKPAGASGGKFRLFDKPVLTAALHRPNSRSDHEQGGASTPNETNGSHTQTLRQYATSRLHKDSSRAENLTTPRLPHDVSRRAWALWRSDPACRSFTVHFTRRAPVRALASYPGSGNTWARYLIEAATGIHTGSVYNDDQLYLNGYRGERENWKSGTTIVQKVHEYSPSTIEGFEGAGVLLLRNPYRAIMSFHNFMFGGHKGYAPIANYRRKDWEPFLHIQIKTWLVTAINWLQNTAALEVLHYEQLKEDPTTSFERILPFLGQPVDHKRLQCIKKHMDGNFHRKMEYFPEDLELFSPSIRDKMDRAIRYVDYLLERKGLTRVPLHLYEFYNGTQSDQITRVPCPPKSNQLECDFQLDTLNKKRQKISFTTSSTAVPESPVTDPAATDEDMGYSFLERLTRSNLAAMLTDTFSEFFYKYNKDPLLKMVNSESAKKFLRAPVPIDSKYGDEAKVLKNEYASDSAIKSLE